jgi:hypothetical protein
MNERETRRGPQPPPHDASYFNLNNANPWVLATWKAATPTH